MLGVLKGLPSGYNKDLQDDKRALFDAVDLMRLVFPAVEGALAEITFDETRMRLALSSTMMATDLADYLVKKGSSFRQAMRLLGLSFGKQSVVAASWEIWNSTRLSCESPIRRRRLRVARILRTQLPGEISLEVRVPRP
jgi:argininosuccinate lyase